jgi:hypothetical protein
METQTPLWPSRPRRRRGRLLAMAAVMTVVLAGCTGSPEAARVPGEAGADVGNHGNPVQLLGSQDEFARVYYGIPYEGPAVASEDTSQS